MLSRGAAGVLDCISSPARAVLLLLLLDPLRVTPARLKKDTQAAPNFAGVPPVPAPSHGGIKRVEQAPQRCVADVLWQPARTRGGERRPCLLLLFCQDRQVLLQSSCGRGAQRRRSLLVVAPALLVFALQ